MKQLSHLKSLQRPKMFTRLVREGMSKEKQKLIANLFSHELKQRQKELSLRKSEALQQQEYQRNATSVEPVNLKIPLGQLAQDSRNHTIEPSRVDPIDQGEHTIDCLDSLSIHQKEASKQTTSRRLKSNLRREPGDYESKPIRPGESINDLSSRTRFNEQSAFEDAYQTIQPKHKATSRAQSATRHMTLTAFKTTSQSTLRAMATQKL